MVEIRINYETLFDLLRREKNREELQTLDKDFYEQVLSYMREKQQMLEQKDSTLFFNAEREKLKIQFHNIRRIVKELYEKREKKIINIALVKARTGSDIIDTSAMLPSERLFFEDAVRIFSGHKDDILSKILELKDLSRAMSVGEHKEPMVNLQPTSEEDGAAFQTLQLKRIKILEYLPKFMGAKGEILGPFDQGAVVELEPQIADILLKKGRAEGA